ncbi:hypothetical protein DNTS_003254 [Danionella cerebrum]|uniref:RAP domain-containing protein n=1 Tax=Danionella cerebrum TaxID=2873325 RepID=A0A553MVD9_9TELE|nr:hypothetical protein DNTS_003254 [Danionella translucida]
MPLTDLSYDPFQLQMSAKLLRHHAHRWLYRHTSFNRSKHTSSSLDHKKEEEEEEEIRKMGITLAYKPEGKASLTPSSYLKVKEICGKSRSKSAYHKQHQYNNFSSEGLSGRIFVKKNANYCAFETSRPEYRKMSCINSNNLYKLQLQEAVLLLDEVTGDLGPAEITTLLSKLSQVLPEHSCYLQNERLFVKLLEQSVDTLDDFTVTQLIDILRSFLTLPLNGFPNVLSAYNGAFCKRANELDLHQLLLAADMWLYIDQCPPRILQQLYGVVTENFNQIGCAELVQLLYIFGESRTFPNTLKEPIGSLIIQHSDQFNGQEIGAVCLGLFKSQAHLSDACILTLVDRATLLVNDMKGITISSIMKILRFSHLVHIPFFDAMPPRLFELKGKMAVQSMMHVLLGFSALSFEKKDVFQTINQQIPRVSKFCRCKDAAKMIWASATLGYFPNELPELYSFLTDVLRERKEEFQMFPEMLLIALHSLAFVGSFPRDLLELVFSPDLMKIWSRSDKYKFYPDLLTLYGTINLESPDTMTPRLSDAMRVQMTEYIQDLSRSDILKKHEVTIAEEFLTKLLHGDMFVRKHMILPHMRSIDLEVHLDENNEPVPVDSLPSYPNCQQSPLAACDDFFARLNYKQNIAKATLERTTHPTIRQMEPIRERESSFSEPLPPSKPLIKKLAIQVSNRNSYCYQTRRLLGMPAMKRRQLALMDYKVVELYHWEWFPLLNSSPKRKLAYLHSKIFS